MPILSKKVLIFTISLVSIGGIGTVGSLFFAGEEKVNLKDRFQSKGTGRIIINREGHHRVWDILLKEYKSSLDNSLPISKDEITVDKLKEMCNSLEQSTKKEKLSRYERYCTRKTWKGSISGLIEVGDKEKWTKQEQKYKDSDSLPIAALNGDSEKLSEWCEGKYEEPYEDTANESDYWHLINWCVWNSEVE